jgi:hypothetical protein
LTTRGAVVVDDVDANWGFRSFTQAFSDHQSMVCEAEPLRPDLRRFNKKGLFGIILKQPPAHLEGSQTRGVSHHRNHRHFNRRRVDSVPIDSCFAVQDFERTKSPAIRASIPEQK